MKFKTFQTLAFMAEVLAFIFVGIYFMKGLYGFSIISYLFGSVIAVYLGRRIEDNAIQEYKEGKR